VEEVGAYIDQVGGFKSIKVIRRAENYGLARSIIDGVSQLLDQHPHVIVLEDDIVVSPFFLKFMNEALAKYSLDGRVASVHGYLYPTTDPLPETFFLRGADCWGWATWRRAWNHFNPNGAELLSQLQEQHLVGHFDLNGAYGYSDMLKAQIAQRNNSWAIRWHASTYLANMLTLYPGRSLVSNIGHDSTGIHCGATTEFDTTLSDTPIVLRDIEVEHSESAYSEFERFFRGPASAKTASALNFQKQSLKTLKNLIRLLLPALIMDKLRTIRASFFKPTALIGTESVATTSLNTTALGSAPLISAPNHPPAYTPTNEGNQNIHHMNASFYQGKKVLITGGLGFIGSNLARALVLAEAEVTLVDSLTPQYGGNRFNIQDFEKRVSVNICDVRDQVTMSSMLQGQDYLFNLAGQTSHLDSMIDPRTDLEINAAAQLSILEACRAVNSTIKIIFASTRQIYGKPDYLPVDEQHPIRPVDVNGINKLAGEWYHILYNNVYGIRSCALRLTNTYGPGMRVKDARQTFLGIWLKRIIEGNPIEIFGDGLQLRDFNHVDDCVDALLLVGLSEKANGKVYNLGGAEVVSLKALAELLQEISRTGTFKLVPFPLERKVIDIGDYYSDFSLIRNELGWTPQVPLRSGLAQTLDYYRLHHPHYWDKSL
jgi:dTDP-glucose 4,6-dehydratase/UDP-glucose 4-epimerase